MINKRDFLLHIQQKEWKHQESRTKTSFWASDCLRPSCDIYWKYIHEQATNPIKPESLLLMQVGKLFELQLVKELVEMGELKDLGEDQIRVDMEREHVKITGYADGVHVTGCPVEIKTHYATSVDKQLENGAPPSDHHCHQLAVYMDFMGVEKGLMINANRANGNIFFSEMKLVGPLLFEINGYCFDLEVEYKRFRKLMEENILPRKEPELEYFYHPDVSKELLEKYPEAKIKKAIRGERILCDHKWRYQYSDYKDKVIQKEADMRGVTPNALCTYTEQEIEFMMDFLGVYWKPTKAGPKLYKKK